MLLTLIACSTNPEPTYLEPIGRVTGQVVDMDGAGIAHAQVEVDGIVVEADIDGNFTVDGVSPGDHLVSFEADAHSNWLRFVGNPHSLCVCDDLALAGSDRRCDADRPPCA